MDFTRLVVLFKGRKNSQQKAEMEFYRGMKSLKEAVEAAALARTPGGTMHPHQCRQGADVLARAKAKLIPRLEDIRRCKSFDELHDLVRELTTEVDRFGPLSVYDTAFRIGIKLGLFPTKIYLHTGTRAGAKALGLDVRNGSLKVKDLPREMWVLKPYEAEDFLCIFHRHFRVPSSDWPVADDDDLSACGQRPPQRKGTGRC